MLIITTLHVSSFDVDHVLASCRRVVWFSALFQDVMVCELICMISGPFLYLVGIVHSFLYTRLFLLGFHKVSFQ